MRKIFVIGIDGGPCSGKTSFNSFIFDALQEHGVRVFFTPEIATTVILGGIRNISELQHHDRPRYLEVERSMFQLQKIIEDHFVNLARASASRDDTTIVVLTDRTRLTPSAYMEPPEFEAILANEKTSKEELYQIYDAIVYLVSAAHGAEAFYTLDNNPARYEKTLEEAREVDQRTLNTYIGYPNPIIIDNSTDFEQKMKRALNAILRTIGKPTPIPGQKKFLLAEIPSLDAPELGIVKSVGIEQFYLPKLPNRKTVRIRKRTMNGISTYYETIKQEIRPGQTLQTQRLINDQEYDVFLAQRDGECAIIRKTRYFFAYKYQYFRLDIFWEPQPLCLLEIEPTEENQTINLPPCFSKIREVTGDPSYDNYTISRS